MEWSGGPTDAMASKAAFGLAEVGMCWCDDRQAAVGQLLSTRPSMEKGQGKELLRRERRTEQDGEGGGGKMAAKKTTAGGCSST